jgi:hypothetical protein
MQSGIIALQQRTFTAKDPMKTPKTAPEKPAREPRISCYQPNYSATALNIMERATGTRITQLAAPVKLPVQAVDAD